jgi:hypothetical protein
LLLIIFFSSIIFLRDSVELSCSTHKDSCLDDSPAGELTQYYYHSLSTITMIPRILGVTILLVIGGGTMTMGLLLPPLSPMLLIQSAEATTTSDESNCFIGSPTIVGTNNDDVIQGTEGDDFIAGLGGNDRILGKGGNDRVCAGDGNDIIYGDNGNDLLYGGAGDDELHGDSNEDDCENDYGEPMPCLGGSDEVYGNDGDDLLHGGVGNDFGDGGRNFDTCVTVETVRNCEG